jgi:thiosulfate dehydrogenase [quinone] large subunit
MREPIPSWMLVPLRLYAGWSLLRAGLGKLSGNWLHEPRLHNAVSGWLHDGKPYGFYAGFLRNVVLPHSGIFSWLVVGGELLVGAALLIGLFIRPAAFFGLLMTLAFLFGQGDPIGANPTAAFVAICLTLLLAAPRALGVDALLHGRVPRLLA